MTAGALGTWAARFGRFFEKRADLVQTLSRLLRQNWHTQNYVGVHFLRALPQIARDDESRTEIVDGLAYALLVNQALRLQEEFLKVAENYPEEWKGELRIALQGRSTSGDGEYYSKALEVLSGMAPAKARAD